MNANVKAVLLTAVGAFVAYLLIRTAEYLETKYQASKAVAATAGAAVPEAEAVGDRTND